MKDKILRMFGFFLVGLGIYGILSMIILPQDVFDKTNPIFLIVGGIFSVIAVAIMINKESEAESMKCPACGREVDALIGRQNDPETKVCPDCYISEDLKEEK